jgi:hypothetical protein
MVTFCSCVILTVLFSIYLQNLFELLAIDFIADNRAKHQVFAHPLENSYPILNSFTCWQNSGYRILFCLDRRIVNDTVELNPKEYVSTPMSVRTFPTTYFLPQIALSWPPKTSENLWKIFSHTLHIRKYFTFSKWSVHDTKTHSLAYFFFT